MVCPQRSWTRSWIFNSYIGVQLKKTAMLVMLYSGNVFVLNYELLSWTMQFAKTNFFKHLL